MSKGVEKASRIRVEFYPKVPEMSKRVEKASRARVEFYLEVIKISQIN